MTLTNLVLQAQAQPLVVVWFWLNFVDFWHFVDIASEMMVDFALKDFDDLQSDSLQKVQPIGRGCIRDEYFSRAADDGHYLILLLTDESFDVACDLLSRYELLKCVAYATDPVQTAGFEHRDELED